MNWSSTSHTRTTSLKKFLHLFYNSRLIIKIHSYIWMRPITQAPESFEFISLNIDKTRRIFPALVTCLHLRKRKPLFLVLLFYLMLNRKPVTIPAGHIGRILAEQALAAHDDVRARVAGDELIALTTRRVVLSGDAPFFLLRPMPMPSRPRRFACLQGKALRAIPAARCLAPLDAAEPAAPDRPAQRPAAMDGTLANTLALAAAGCAGACRPQRWRFLPITSRRTVHGQPARHRYGASTPRLKTGAARCGRGVLACRRVVDLACVSGRASAAFMRGCRVGSVSFRCGSAQGVLVLL